MKRSRTFLFAFFMLATCFSAKNDFADDLLTNDYVLLAVENKGTKRVEGTILDLNGRDGLVIKTATLEEHFPMTQVLDFGTVLVDSHVNAEQLMKSGDFQAALVQFQAARNEETRIWVKRQITARIVQTFSALGDFDKAVQEFYLLAQSDPETPFLASIPLPWFAVLEREQRSLQLGQKGIDKPEFPAMQLLAAGLLLTSPEKNKAVDVLKMLSKSRNEQIAALATAQLWRSRLFSATLNDALLWEEQADQMPETLQAGPHYLLGELFARLGDQENAVAHWMKVVILFPEQRELATQAQTRVAKMLESLGRPVPMK